MAAWRQSREALLERGVVTGLALLSEKKRMSLTSASLIGLLFSASNPLLTQTVPPKLRCVPPGYTN